MTTPTLLPITKMPSGYAVAGADALFQAADTGNGNEFSDTGEELVLIWNTDTPTNEVQTITQASTPTGTFGLSWVAPNGQTYISVLTIAATAAAATVATALLAAVSQTTGNALSADYPLGTIVGGGGPLPATPVTLTFGGQFGGQALNALVPNNGGLVGGTFGVTRSTPGAGGHTYTITSQPDSPAGRTGDEGPVVVGAGNIKTSQLFPTAGWVSGGHILLTANSTFIKFAVLRVP